MRTLSVIIPAYNEAENIGAVVDACEKILPELTDAYEIILVNDGSDDATAKIADELANEVHSVKVFHHDRNRGMGAAVATGIRHARYDMVCTIPADLQFDVADLIKLLPLMDRADFVIAYRVNRDYNWYRWMITYTNIILLRVLFGLKVKDPNWVKVYRRKIFDSIQINSTGFFWDAEMLIKANRQGLHIEEVPVPYHPRAKGRATGGTPKAAVQTFFALVKFWIRERR